ncbi:MAG: GntR family transcriptional regulator [Bacillota bacterium]
MLIVLDSSDRQPLYQQIIEQVRAAILRGEVSPGDPLPSIRQLAADLVTSVITTQRAYQELERDGYIVTRPGRGTFVSELSRSPRDLTHEEIGAQLAAVVEQARRLGVGPESLRALLEQAMKAGGYMHV